MATIAREKKKKKKKKAFRKRSHAAFITETFGQYRRY
jgi:hypothetical protein